MRFLLLFLISVSLFANTTAVEKLYLKALKYEEIDANFMKAKQVYSQIIAEHVTEQEYVARAMYHIAFISEMYNQKATAENYYKMLLSKYKQFKGLQYLANNGLMRLKANPNQACKPAPAKAQETKVAPKKVETAPVKKPADPFYNNKYRKGKTAPLYILSINEATTIPFDGIKGIGASTTEVASIEPTTSSLKLTGKKVGFVEVMIKDNQGKENYVHVQVVDATHNQVKDVYLIEKEAKEIMLTNLEKIAVDNDNLELSAKNNTISLKAKKAGNVTLTLMKKDGTKVDISLKVLKPFDKKVSHTLNSLETREVKFESIASISVTTHGIVDVKQEGDKVKITGTAKGKTVVIIYGKDSAQLKLDIEVI